MSEDIMEMDAPELAAVLQGRCAVQTLGLRCEPAAVIGYDLLRGNLVGVIETVPPGMVTFLRQSGLPRRRKQALGIRGVL